ncbi:MAG: cohesin domain-containing protein [Candidatus Saccharimonadales bacterium]
MGSKITQTLRKPISLASIFFVAAVVISAWTLQYVLAATGTIYLTPASHSVQVGNNMTVGLRINPGVEVNAVVATINFDKSKLQYVSYTAPGTPFNMALKHTAVNTANANGAISIEYGAMAVNGNVDRTGSDSLVVSLTFKALANSGTTNISLSNANANAYSNSEDTNPSVAGATVSFKPVPVATCPSGQVGTPPNCKTPTPSTPTPPKTPTIPKTATPKTPTNTPNPAQPVTPAAPTATSTGSKPEVSGETPIIQHTRGTLAVNSNVPTTAYIKYGFEKDSLPMTTAVSPLATSHLLALDFGAGSAGQTFYYSVVMTDSDGNESQTEVQAIKTKGIPVKITIVDKSNKPLKKKKVTLHSDPITVTTDSQGIATINDVAPGNHELRYTLGGKVYSKAIVVADNVETNGETQSAAVQNFSVTYDLTQPTVPWIAYVGGLLLLAILAGGSLLIIGRRNSSIPKHPSSSGAAAVGVEKRIPQQPIANQTIAVVPSPDEPKQKQLSKIEYPQVPSPGNVVQPNASDNKKELQ